MPFTLNDYQAAALATAMYPKPFETPLYPALGLNGEEGETAGVIVELTFPLTDVQRSTLMKEFGDQAWYLANLLSDIGMGMDALAGSRSPDVAEIQESWYPWWQLEAEIVANFTRAPMQALALSKACGIVAEHAKKAWRDDGGKVTASRRDKLFAASCIVFHDWLELVSMYGFPAEEILHMNLAKLASRKARGVLGGSGDHR